jgi:hypothetical protein
MPKPEHPHDFHLGLIVPEDHNDFLFPSEVDSPEDVRNPQSIPDVDMSVRPNVPQMPFLKQPHRCLLLHIATFCFSANIKKSEMQGLNVQEAQRKTPMQVNRPSSILLSC